MLKILLMVLLGPWALSEGAALEGSSDVDVPDRPLSGQGSHFHLGRGNLLYYEGKLHHALKAYEDEISAFPSDVRGYLNAGIVLRDFGRHRESVSKFEIAIALAPGNPDIQAAFGWAALRSKELKRAEFAFKAALEKSPKHRQALFGLARINMERKNYDRAVYRLKQLTRHHPDFSLGYFYLGRALAGKNDLKGAAQAYRKTYRTDKTFAEIRVPLAKAYSEMGRPDKAWEQYAKILVVDSRSKKARRETKRLSKQVSRKKPSVVPVRRAGKPFRVRHPQGWRNMLEIRVGIGADMVGSPIRKKKVTFWCTGRFLVIDPESGRRLARGPPNKKWTALRTSGGWYKLVNERGRRVARFRRVIMVTPANPKMHSLLFHLVSVAKGSPWASFDDKQLKNKVEIRVHSRGGLYLVNELPLEDYLYGVVCDEMPAHFPYEALKAQAVIARTHALYVKKRLRCHRKYAYDICDSQHCQVYGGVAGENSQARRVVNATRGEVLYYGKSLIQAPYSSNCGGHIQSSSEVTGWVKLPYLKGRLDAPDSVQAPDSPWSLDLWLKGKPKTYCNIFRYMHSSQFRWTRVVQAHELEERANRRKNIGKLLSLAIVKRSRSGNVNKIQFQGTQGRLTINLEHKIRNILGMASIRSTMFAVEVEKDDNGMPKEFIFYGGGWGHGVGLCQYGAAGRALKGATYKAILKHYYFKTHLKKIRLVR